MRLALAVAVLTTLASGSAAAQESPLASVLAYPMWEVEAGADLGSEVTGGRQTIVSSARLLPAAVVAPKQDVTSLADGAVLVPAGTVLSRYRTSGGFVFCAVRLLKKLSGKVPCLIDGDGDGRFDRAIRILIVDGAGGFRGAVIQRGAPVPVAPVESVVLDPADYPAPQKVAIVMTGAGSNNASFDVVIDDGRSKPMPIGGLRRTLKGAMPLSGEVFGARLIVQSLGGGKARVRIEQPIPKQPFLLTNGLI